jgi:rhodanese-related sulfurtransferase
VRGREITATELAERLRAGRPTRLVDVREDWERGIAALRGDVHVPMNEVPGRLEVFRSGAGELVVAYCHAGVRSLRVAVYLEENGVPGVRSLAGGIDAWSLEVDPRIARY